MIAGQQEALCAAVTMAAGWAETVRNAYQDIYRHRKHRRRRKREWKTSHGGAFAYWFGARWTGRVTLYTVHRRIKKMQRLFERGLRFTIIKEQGGYRSYNCNTVPAHNQAYTVAPVIYICPDFFRGAKPSDSTKGDIKGTDLFFSPFAWSSLFSVFNPATDNCFDLIDKTALPSQLAPLYRLPDQVPFAGPVWQRKQNPGNVPLAPVQS